MVSEPVFQESLRKRGTPNFSPKSQSQTTGTKWGHFVSPKKSVPFFCPRGEVKGNSVALVGRTL